MKTAFLSPSFLRSASEADALRPGAGAVPERTIATPPTASRRGALSPWMFAPLLLVAAASTGLLAQETPSDGADTEDMVVLSPFEVTGSDSRGYSYYSPRVPAPIAQPTFGGGNGSGCGAPSVPITLIRRADAVVIEFALSNSADKQDQRNKQLTDSVDALAAQIKATPGLRFENREVQLMSGNRSRSIIGKGGVVTSFANFAIFADLGADDARLYERVKQVRALVSAAKLDGGTKVIDGPVALYLKRPNDLRKELLGKIFEDYELVKQGLGADFEVLVTGLNGPVRLRSCSEREVELWIDYSFTIRSIVDLRIREMEARRTEKKS